MNITKLRGLLGEDYSIKEINGKEALYKYLGADYHAVITCEDINDESQYRKLTVSLWNSLCAADPIITVHDVFIGEAERIVNRFDDFTDYSSFHCMDSSEEAKAAEVFKHKADLLIGVRYSSKLIEGLGRLEREK